MTQQVVTDIMPVAFVMGMILGASTVLLGFNICQARIKREQERQIKDYNATHGIGQVPKGRALDRLLKQLLQGK